MAAGAVVQCLISSSVAANGHVEDGKTKNTEMWLQPLLSSFPGFLKAFFSSLVLFLSFYFCAEVYESLHLRLSAPAGNSGPYTELCAHLMYGVCARA